MTETWQPEIDLEKLARRFVARVAAAVRRTAPKVEHRGDGGAVGGSLPARIRRAGLVIRRPWGVIVDWPSLGQPFHHFVYGTKRQKARPVDLSPTEEEVVRTVEESGARHFERRDSRAAAERP